MAEEGEARPGAAAAENDQIQARRGKLAELAAAGRQAYGGRYERTHTAAQALEAFARLEGAPVRLAGRIRALRLHGRAAFADLEDGSGRIQLFARADTLGEAEYGYFTRLDLGDIVGVEGPLLRTRRGEVSVQVQTFQLLAKALRPLPEKWHGLKDTEVRYRRRYLDLTVNRAVREVFVLRSRVLAAIRTFLSGRGFLEVETPVLHPVPGGANARPFTTYHRALAMPLYLRIAPELYLKRLLVGGFERVFEIGKNFRNEGISTRHNPEYTAVEVYQAYADGETMMRLTEELFAFVAQEATGSTRIEYRGQALDLAPPWPRLEMLEAVRRHAGVDLAGAGSATEARALARQAGVEVGPQAAWGDVVVALFEERAEEHLTGPVFITGHPLEISPLAKARTDDPRLADRFEPYLAGWELANGFSELNDPAEQRERFRRQAERRARGDEEAHALDEEFLVALEHGMPPAGGLGVGVDRLVMLLAGVTSIREVILFPHLRPEGGRPEPGEP